MILHAGSAGRQINLPTLGLQPRAHLFLPLLAVALLAAAVRDIDGIFDYSVTTHGPEVAKAYLRDIDAAIARLLEYPESGMASNLRLGVRSIAAREHRIYCRIDGSKLVIARVLYKAMDPARRL